MTSSTPPTKLEMFTTRLEVRVPATLATPDYYSELTSKLKSAVADDAFNHLDSRVYLEYIRLYINAISELAELCLGSVLLESLSGLNLAAYMLNSLMHREDTSNIDANAFVPVGETIMFGHTFDMARMRKVFSDPNVHEIVSRRTTGFEFPAITLGPLRVYSECFTGSVIPVE
ncbi:uncharacterized protein EV154DRAFT_489100, partial [Mucor mucedo]|uniref:uncharacterized protein n=1 Tax=Mucor mucedo TaxID=29922 RepID=UPI0022203A3B